MTTNARRGAWAKYHHWLRNLMAGRCTLVAVYRRQARSTKMLDIFEMGHIDIVLTLLSILRAWLSWDHYWLGDLAQRTLQRQQMSIFNCWNNSRSPRYVSWTLVIDQTDFRIKIPSPWVSKSMHQSGLIRLLYRSTPVVHTTVRQDTYHKPLSSLCNSATSKILSSVSNGYFDLCLLSPRTLRSSRCLILMAFTKRT